MENPFCLDHFQRCQTLITDIQTKPESLNEKLEFFIENQERRVKDTLATIFRLAELAQLGEIDFQSALIMFIYAVKLETSEVLKEDNNESLHEITSIAFFQRAIETSNSRFNRDILEFIYLVQSRCKFYNYEIAKSDPHPSINYEKLSASSSPSYNFYGPVANVANTVYGNQINNQQTEINKQE